MYAFLSQFVSMETWGILTLSTVRDLLHALFYFVLSLQA
jgi:hypothetical protein